MRTYFLALALGLAAQGGAPHAAAASPQGQTLSCSTSPVDKNFGKKELWDGYEVSVGPTAHFEDDSGADDACTAVIYDQSGKEVYRTTGPGVRFDPATGMDVDGDGAPDVVLMNGASGATSGGSGWNVEVISLKPQPHLLFGFGQDFPPAAFSKDSQQRVVLWLGESGDELALAYEWPMAARPGAQRIYRWIDGRLADVTPAALEELRTTKNLADVDSDTAQTGARVLSLILQRIFCHQFDQALDAIHQLWPQGDQVNLIKHIKEISKGWNCPECASQIEQWR